MKQTNTTNRRFVLAERPEGAPTGSTLTLKTDAVPSCRQGEMLLRTEFLSLDPYMRGRMSDAPSYAPPVEIGEVMVGGTIAQVETSKLDGFEKGDWVLSSNGWQDYALSNGEGVTPLGREPEHPSWALGVTGMPGFTAWAGLTKIGKPRARETLVVAAATGPVGATVGQVEKTSRMHGRRNSRWRGEVCLRGRDAWVGCMPRSSFCRLQRRVGGCNSSRNRYLLRERRRQGL
jgi:NADPH-dependent curcumin reductase